MAYIEGIKMFGGGLSMNIKNNFSKSFVTMALGAALLLPAMATVSAEDVASAPATAPADH